METKLIGRTLPAVNVDASQSLTSLGRGIQNPTVTHLLTSYMEYFSGQLAEAKADAQEENCPTPSSEAISMARGALENWLSAAISLCLNSKMPRPVIGASFTFRGEIELVFRDVGLDQDRVLWIAQDAKRAKLLGIDENLRVTRQITERLW